MKIVRFWDLTPCSSVDGYQLFLSQIGGSRSLRNVGASLPKYTSQHFEGPQLSLVVRLGFGLN